MKITGYDTMKDSQYFNETNKVKPNGFFNKEIIFIASYNDLQCIDKSIGVRYFSWTIGFKR